MNINIKYEYKGNSNFIYFNSNSSFKDLIKNLIEEESIEPKPNEVVILYDKKNNQIRQNRSIHLFLDLYLDKDYIHSNIHIHFLQIIHNNHLLCNLLHLHNN